MDDELTPEEKFNAEDPETFVPRALRLGRSPEDIVADLVRLDWSPAAAQRLVQRAAEDLRRYQESPETRRALAEEARKQKASGCMLAALGLLTMVGASCAGWLFLAVPIVLVAIGVSLWTRGQARLRVYGGEAAEAQEKEGTKEKEQDSGPPDSVSSGNG